MEGLAFLFLNTLYISGISQVHLRYIIAHRSFFVFSPLMGEGGLRSLVENFTHLFLNPSLREGLKKTDYFMTLIKRVGGSLAEITTS